MYNQNNILFEPYNGLIRGNMFKNIYDDYSKIYEIRPMNEKAELLTYIDMYDFACIDLSLFLDVNPNNNQLINIYNQINNEKNNIIKQYESKYGPLSLSSTYKYDNNWSWNNSPWPWEV